MIIWRTTRFAIDLSRPRVMGIVNATPDSFADGGSGRQALAAIALVDRHLEAGADLIDIGGESTRPGATAVPAREERARVLPVLRHAVRQGVPVSVDTRRLSVMQMALDEGADIINDVQALQAPGAARLLARQRDTGICLMHMRGEPKSMRQLAHYVDVVREVSDFLQGRVAALEALGVARDRIVLDPGIGFAKTAEHNLMLHRRQSELVSLGFPLLVGWSRKATLGTITGRAVDDRLVASVTAALASAVSGARILRVHDVAATVDALRVWQAFDMPRSAHGEQQPPGANEHHDATLLRH
ncbi:MAG: dihydropteroate synthase [Rubrivivax sp.]